MVVGIAFEGGTEYGASCELAPYWIYAILMHRGFEKESNPV